MVAARIKPLGKFIKFWLPVIIYGIVIFRLSAIPGSNIPCVFPYQDILAHILEYAGFGLLLSRAVKAYYPAMAFRRRFFLVVGCALVYALSDEFHQSFVPGRTPSGLDVLDDGIGIVLGYLLYR